MSVGNEFASVYKVTNAVAIPADSAPNAVAPTAARQVLAPPLKENGQLSEAIIYSLDGTSIDVTLWFLDATFALWVQAGAKVTLLPSVPQFIHVPPAARMFAQLTANVGNTKNFGMGFT
jgi:hypothetical protein